MKKIVEKMINDAIIRLQKNEKWSSFDVPLIIIDRPKSIVHGDWTTNICFMLAKILQSSPLVIMDELSVELRAEKNNFIESITAIAPGYINFSLQRSVLIEELQKINEKNDNYGNNDALNGQTIMIEYTQPNPFKPFHIGHLMSNTIGESLSRIIAFSGAKVIRANYQGDVGPHVAKSLWAIQKFGYDINNIDEIGQAYAKGHEAYETDENAKKEIHAINKAIYTCSDETLMRLYAIGRSRTLERFEEIYAILGTKFDVYYFESDTWKRGEKIVREHMGDIFEESEGAIIFDGEKYGLHKRVFITTQGLPTYEAKDVGLAMLKKETYPSDQYIMTTAVEQEEYFKVIKKAIELVDPSFINKFIHIAHGMMQLTTGKMSSRKGNVITGESLIADAQTVAKAKMSERAIDDMQDATINMIAVAGIKFSILKQHTGKNIMYDAQSALSFDGDSGPYVQYTYARCRSVIAKAQGDNIVAQWNDPCKNSVELERLLVQFSEVTLRASQDRAPHYIANYVIDCARSFNAFYATTTIVDKSDPLRSAYRVAIAQVTAQIIKNSLYLLGIQAPEKM